MNMTLNLSFEDGLKVTEAMRNTAIENGWDAEELADCGVIEEYASAVDAALTAMGIKISINGTPSYEEDDFDNSDDEDYDDEDDDDTCQCSLTARDEFIIRYIKVGHSLDEACEVANILFGNEEDE